MMPPRLCRWIALLAVGFTVWSSPGPARAATADSGDEVFIKRILPMMWGRQPLSSRELNVMVQLVQQTDRSTFVRSLAKAPEYRHRWAPFIRDLLAVYRIGDPTNIGCYAESAMESVGPELAAHVRDQPPEGLPFSQSFTMMDLIDSSLQLDDLSPVFRANLFAHLRRDYRTADLGGARAARQSRAKVFLGNQLNRRFACMGCHNSEYSITGSDDPLLDRTWEVPGYFEKALFGVSGGTHISTMRPFFRRKGVLAGFEYLSDGADEEPNEVQYLAGHAPWGMHDECGRFYTRDLVWADDMEEDLPYLAGELDSSASVWELETHMHSGFKSLRDGLNLESDMTVDGDQAMAWLIGMSVVDTVWLEVFNHRLTIANRFPRTAIQRDTLDALTQVFVYNDYSLLAVLESIATGTWFNRPNPASGQEEPHPYPPVFDPWIDDDKPPSERYNGPTDMVARWPARVLLSRLYAALEWELPKEFPQPFLSVDAMLLRQVGVYLKDGDPGFRSISFQSLLAWETHFGVCAKHKVNPTHLDWIDRLVLQAEQDSGTVTFAHLIAALKDRLLNDPDLGDATEQSHLAAILDTSLDAPMTEPDDTTARLRRVCGVFAATPQFLLGGWSPPDVLTASGEANTVCQSNLDCAPPMDQSRVQDNVFVMLKTSFHAFCETLGPLLLGPCRVECKDQTLTVFDEDHACAPLVCPDGMKTKDTNEDGWDDACELDCPPLSCELNTHAADTDDDGCYDTCEPGGGCAGICDIYVVSSPCQCDAGCFETGDCCEDICAVCGEDFADLCGVVIESSDHFCAKPQGSCDGAGTCAVKPTTSCTSESEPVCGCDGRTYTNTCMAAAAGVTTQQDGACPVP